MKICRLAGPHVETARSAFETVRSAFETVRSAFETARSAFETARSAFLISVFCMANFWTAAGAQTIQGDIIQGDIWIPRDHLSLADGLERGWDYSDLSDTEKTEINTLIQEAVWIFSGIIYGFFVDWTPAHQRRGIAEKLSVELVQNSTGTSNNVRASDAVVENNFIIVKFEYSASETEMNRYNGWRSPAFPAASARISTSIWDGSTRQALKNAIRQALYNRLSVRDFNRPKRVRAKVAFSKFPSIKFSKSGLITVLANLKVDLTAIEYYSLH